MGRSNNGVPSKVYNDVGRGSINRGSGQEGKMGEEGGLKPVGAEMNHSEVSNEMNAIRGSKGSSGTEKDFGGVGSYGDNDARQDFFEEKH